MFIALEILIFRILFILVKKSGPLGRVRVLRLSRGSTNEIRMIQVQAKSIRDKSLHYMVGSKNGYVGQGFTGCLTTRNLVLQGIIFRAKALGYIYITEQLSRTYCHTPLCPVM